MSSTIIVRTGGLLAILGLLVLQGCTTSAAKSAGMRNMLMQGRADQALMVVEKEADTDDVMVNMNLGILRAMNGKFEASNKALEIAKEKIKDLYSTSITEQAAAVIVNDETISFDGDRYEQVLVHAYMALNYISLGDLDSARVEILQSDAKMMEWGDAPEEDPFMRYLAGIVFEALGDENDAMVMYRSAIKVYKATKSRHGLGVPTQLKKDFLTLLAKAKLWGEYKDAKRQLGMGKWKPLKNKGKGEVVLIMNNGLSPQRDQKTIQSYSSAMALNVKIALPTYPNPPKYVDQMRVSVGGKSTLMETVENVDGLARAALDDDIALITTRAIARAVAKKASEKEAGDQGGGWAQLAMLVVNSATEIADTRCWNTLPQEVQISRLYLPAGNHNLRVDVIGQGGVIRDTMTIPVVVKAGGKTVVSKHWTGPRAVAPTGTPANPASTSGGHY
jgi:uncharacterized protein